MTVGLGVMDNARCIVDDGVKTFINHSIDSGAESR